MRGPSASRAWSSSRIPRSAVIAMALAAILVTSGAVAPAGARQLVDPWVTLRAERPSIVLILTDDQRWDSLWAMPNVQRLLVREGVTFANAFVVNSLCCPSRSSILTGEYSHSTGVYTNSAPDGGFSAFDDASTIATWLHDAGYTTGLFGKYLNEYPGGYVPPGWDRWNALVQEPKGGTQYFDWTMAEGTGFREFGHDPRDYSTSVFGSRAAGFIRSTDGPLFVDYAPFAPHGPPVPAPGDAGAFDALLPSRPPSLEEADVGDKPAYISDRPELTGTRVDGIDAFRRGQFETLPAVDRGVRDIVRALRDTGRLDSAMIVFTSDNGYSWGEHRWFGKEVPYDESIRVPMVVRYQPLAPAGQGRSQLALNIDLAPTFAEVAGVRAPRADGRSLLPLLAGKSTSWRYDFLVEHEDIDGSGRAPGYCAVRSTHQLYVEYETDEEEYYDLAADPFELSNLAGNPAVAAAQADLEARLRTLCRPPPPGMAPP